jgi:hypothetical protein
MSTSHFADEPSQLPLDYLRGLMSVSKDVSVDEQYRGESSGVGEVQSSVERRPVETVEEALEVWPSVGREVSHMTD